MCTWGFCGTWAAVQSTKSWSWETLWRPFTTLGNFKDCHHNSENPPNVISPCSSACPRCAGCPRRQRAAQPAGSGEGRAAAGVRVDHLLLGHRVPAFLWFWLPHNRRGGWPPLRSNWIFQKESSNCCEKYSVLFRRTSKLHLLLFGGWNLSHFLVCE